MAAIAQIKTAPPPDSTDSMQAIVARERLKSLMLRAWILAGIFFMALPGTLLGFSNLMAISTHHGLGSSSGGVDPGSRTCAGIRLDRQLHSRNRILFAAIAWAVGGQDSADMLRSVDLRRCDAMDSKHLRLALALGVPDLCRI